MVALGVDGSTARKCAPLVLFLLLFVLRYCVLALVTYSLIPQTHTHIILIIVKRYMLCLYLAELLISALLK